DVLGDEPGSERGREREQGRGWVAPWIGDHPSAPNAIAGELGETVDRLFQESRGRVRVPVPALVKRRIAQPKVASDVDDDPAIVEPPTSLPRGLTSRQRGKDHLGIADVRSDHDRLG